MRTRNRRGAYAVEFTLILPAWLALVFGAFDVSWVMYRSAALSAASDLACDAGARLDPGAADVDLASLDAEVEAVLADELTLFGSAPTGVGASVVIDGAAPDRRLVCTVTQPIPSLSGYVLPNLGLERVRSSQLQWQREVAP